MKDVFSHELNLIVTEGDKTLLVVGCAHNGVVNIVQHFYNMKGYMPHYVIGGFHLSSRSGFSEELSQIEKISEYCWLPRPNITRAIVTPEAYQHLKGPHG